MRRHAFLLVIVAALHARAATIPELSSEKKLVDIVPENLDKSPEISSSEQEFLDQANIIKDVDNKLRTKPEVIPVEVIVEDTQAALKTGENADESEIIDRPTPDLRNPGPPQRQEHETQNPEYYAAEQETILNFKKSVSDAEIFLKQGLLGITDGIQKVLENKEPLTYIHQSIKSLREGFTDQLSKINGTVQNYLNLESSNVDKPSIEQTKANFLQIEKGLFTFKNEFNNRVKTLADSVEIVAALKAGNETPGESNPTAPAQAPAVSEAGQFFQNIQSFFGNTLSNFTQLISNYTQNQQWNFPNPFTQPSTATVLPAGAQSDTPTTSSQTSPGNFLQNIQNNIANLFKPTQVINQGVALFQTPAPGQGSGSRPILQTFQAFQQHLANLIQVKPPTQAPNSAQTSAPVHLSSSEQPHTEQPKPETSVTAAHNDGHQTDAVNPAGPVRQLLRNKPITQGIAGAVQKVQNDNPEKLREVERIQEQKSELVEKQEIENALDRGHYRPGGTNNGVSDDNSDSSGSRVEESVAKAEEKVPEIEKPQEEEIREHKTEQVAVKTE